MVNRRNIRPAFRSERFTKEQLGQRKRENKNSTRNYGPQFFCSRKPAVRVAHLEVEWETSEARPAGGAKWAPLPVLDYSEDQGKTDCFECFHVFEKQDAQTFHSIPHSAST